MKINRTNRQISYAVAPHSEQTQKNSRPQTHINSKSSHQ